VIAQNIGHYYALVNFLSVFHDLNALSGLKQLFALGEAAVRSKQAVETSISISMIALTVVRRLQLETVDASKDQHERPKPASSIVNNIKLSSFNTFISRLASPGEVLLLKKFRARFCKENLSSKPTVDFTMSG
jgi:hypothetical protein